VGCAGVGIGQTRAPAEGAAASGDSGSGGDDVIHEIERPGLHGTSVANDSVLFGGETGQAAQPTVARAFNLAGAGNSAFDVSARNKLGDGSGQHEIGG